MYLRISDIPELQFMPRTARWDAIARWRLVHKDQYTVATLMALAPACGLPPLLIACTDLSFLHVNLCQIGWTLLILLAVRLWEVNYMSRTIKDVIIPRNISSSAGHAAGDER